MAVKILKSSRPPKLKDPKPEKQLASYGGKKGKRATYGGKK